MIEINSLSKKFKKVNAVNNLSLSIKKGELFGFLGPNGAGKTTTIHMLTTILPPSGGSATINGYDINKQSDEVRKSIGIVFQDMTLDDKLSAYDNLKIHGILYGLENNEIEKRIEEMLALVELSEKKHELVKTFSGGMKRRLEIARGLMHTPAVLFLDEPTLGLDPQTRRHIWSYIIKLKKSGVTILITTHYLEEADALCDRVAIIDHGKIVAIGTPKELKSNIGGNLISIECDKPKKMAEIIEKNNFGDFKVLDEKCTIKINNGSEIIPKIVNEAHNNGVKIESIDFHLPSLEDVFIHYTGKTIREETPGRGMKHGHP